MVDILSIATNIAEILFVAGAAAATKIRKRRNLAIIQVETRRTQTWIILLVGVLRNYGKRLNYILPTGATAHRLSQIKLFEGEIINAERRNSILYYRSQ